MKRRLLGVAICLCVGIGLTAYPDRTEAAETTAKSTEEVSAVSDDQITGEFTYWTWAAQAEFRIEEFNKKYPNIKVNLEIFGGDEYKTKILTTLQSGQDIPDLFDLEEAYVYQFLDSDLIQDLGELGFDEYLDDLYPYQAAFVRNSEGKIKCMPIQSSPVALWYLRDAAEKWLGTSDPEKIAAMMTSFEDITALAKKVQEDSNGEVHLFDSCIEFVKICGPSLRPFVCDGVFEIEQGWYDLCDSLRGMYDEGVLAGLGGWSAEWAEAWNAGELIFRVMPSWDSFTDWEKNSGNVGLCVPFMNGFEGNCLQNMYSGSENKEAVELFMRFMQTDEFQTANLTEKGQVPIHMSVTEKMMDGYSDEKFGGQNILKTYDEILRAVPDVSMDKYTRDLQNKFQSAMDQGIKAGETNDQIMENFKDEARDAYPELNIE